MSAGKKCLIGATCALALLAFARPAAAQKLRFNIGIGGSGGDHHDDDHHHHDAQGHRVDDEGHHIDLHGNHTGRVGVYDDGRYSRPRYETRRLYTPSIPQNSAPYVVRRPVFSGEPIAIVNPAGSPGPVNYLLNSFTYSMTPGQTQTVPFDRYWTIQFDRGHGEIARYSLRPGFVYSFGPTGDGHWELYRGQPAVAALPQPQ